MKRKTVDIKTLHELYAVELAFKERIVGGIPKDEAVMVSWLVSRAKMTPDEAKEKAAQIAKEVAANPEEGVQKGVTTFKRDDKGIYIEERQIKALLREAAQSTGLLKKYGMRDLIAHAIFTDPIRIHLKRNGAYITEEDGYDERALHVMTRQGPRDALKRAFYIEKPSVSFTLKITRPIFQPKPKAERDLEKAEKKSGKKDVVEKKEEKLPSAIDGDTLKTLFVVGEDIGLGADRSQSEGKYATTKFNKLA